MYTDLIEALRQLGIPLAEHAWDVRPDTDYLVIAIDDEANSLHSDNHKECQAPQGTVDLFTVTNDRSTMLQVQNVLNTFDGCAWHLNSVQYEDDTRLLHWEWVFSLEMW